MKQETLNKYINTTKGVLTVIDLDHEEYDKEKQRKRSYFKCYCNRCGKETIVRSDRFGKSNYKPKSCSNCVNDLQKQIAETKYPSEEKKLRDRVSSIIACANGRNYKMNLTREEIKEYLVKPCYYCNCENCMGIDRLDSKKDYSKDNCVSCCTICNRMKNKYDLNTFLDKVYKIYNKFYNESSTTISKESTLQANGNGSGELLTAA